RHAPAPPLHTLSLHDALPILPGSSSTRLPRHSLLLASYHMSRPCLKPESPCLRKITEQPAAPGLDGGVQYRPIDSNVGTPRAPRSEEHTSELQSRGHLVCRLL